MTQFKLLFVEYLHEPIEVDPTGCKTVSAFIEKVQKKFSPQLDEFSLDKLTLHRYTGTKLKPHMNICELVKPPFQNDGGMPLLIRCADEILPVVKEDQDFSSIRRKKEKMGRTQCHSYSG
jgi:hypothetical protein